MSSNLRVAIVVSRYHLPGETFVNYHVQNLMGGNTVVICMATAGPPPDDRPVLALTEQRSGVLDRLVAPVARIGNWLRHGSHKVPTGAQARALRAFLQDQKVDLILCEFGHRAPQMAPVARALNLPLFTYFRGADASKILRDRGMARAYRHVAGHLKGTFAVSQFLLDNLARQGAQFANAHVIPSGADTAQFRPTEKRPGTVLAIGRMVEKKRPDITTRAFIAGARADPTARFTLVGDGPMLETCRAMVEQAGLTDRIQLPGAWPHQKIAQALGETAIFAQHSVVDRAGNTEGLPTVIQEAMACGCAVVSTRHAGIPEAVLEGRTGVLVDEGDEPAFTSALIGLLSDPSRVTRLGQAGRQHALAHLDKKALTAKIEAVLRQAL